MHFTLRMARRRKIARPCVARVTIVRYHDSKRVTRWERTSPNGVRSVNHDPKSVSTLIEPRSHRLSLHANLTTTLLHSFQNTLSSRSTISKKKRNRSPRRIVDRQTRDLILRFYVLSPFAFILSFGLSTIIVPFERHLRLSLLHTATFPIIAISIKYSYRINDLFDKKYTRNYQVPFDRSFIKKDIGDRFGDYLSELFIVIGLDSLGRCVVESRESKWKNERMREFAFARKRALFTEEKLERLERYSYNRCTRLNPVPLHSTRS